MTYEPHDTAHRLNKTLGLYKAEWLNEAIFSLFNEPSYFDELRTHRPCVLIGGRGTGKTTVLRGLSYQGQKALSSNTTPIIDWPFYGLYYRVNTNRVTAFRGAELTEEKWASYFGHYINLIFCQQLLDFVNWFEKNANITVEISSKSLKKVAVTLGLEDIQSTDELAEEIEYLILDFEALINTVSDNPPEQISSLGAPLDALARALLSSPQLEGKQFFFLIDEFENFEDYQQRVLNTIIKHANTDYTFKIGVRELGWRQRGTLNSNELLTSPADYARISIADRLNESRFPAFAESVIRQRISSAFAGEASVISTPHQLLPSLSELEEAEILLGTDGLSRLRDRLSKIAPADVFQAAINIDPGHLYFLSYWGDNSDVSFLKNVESWIANKSEWKQKLDNHFHASLYAIRKGKRGISKHYSGWDTYVSLANGNIRYLLELVHAAFIRHVENEGTPNDPISPKSQTEAAEDIGRKNLSELEGLSVEGGKLTKLVLSIGRILQVMASDAYGHAPEVNQFHIKQDTSRSEDSNQVKQLLDQAVMHLAFVRSPGNKLMSESDTADYDYRLHPIFSPLFVFSHRKKRKFLLAEQQILGLISRPKDTIKEVLSQSNRSDDVNLPDQLSLFGSYYA
ncbi:hypothetical protein [Pseudomonas wadenswilerensis]|uniref:ORC-CDC6 family AAA ATPase n=1 Tax=Pseudomonas wadenswilerensis TaxID=1785161 RepID=UPI00215DD7A6|nr:hypothetical protein [Pseudomonas wadenswilerensis]UVM21165.1 hypothetical protein LOY45_22450 [Pseudomonas wadenswilerensis]